MPETDNQHIQSQFSDFITDNVLKNISLKLGIGLILMFYFVYLDVFVIKNMNAVLTRIVPISLVIMLLIFCISTSKYRHLKVKIYNFFLANIVIMMYLKCIVHFNDSYFNDSVSGTILAMFLMSLEVKSSLRSAIIIFFVPLVAFIIFLYVHFNVGSKAQLSLANIYPIAILGFTINRIQVKLNFKVFKSNYLLNNEKERTKELYEETRLQNENLNQKNIEVEYHRNKVEKAHKNLTDSVIYAKRIQNAMLPTEKLFQENFGEYSILFKPRDVVSGDFYWAKKAENKFFYAAADCTGHGVPGAFVSMLGMSLLNEIIVKHKNNSAGNILNILRTALKISLKQEKRSTKLKDGMDIAFCIIDLDTKTLQYAGAYNPLFIVRNNELIEQKADRQPIGYHTKEKDFSTHEIQLEKNDVIYTFSDGYVDQFHHKTGEKFKMLRLKNLLLQIAYFPLLKQKKLLENHIEEWQGDTEQIDDIVIIALKI